MFHVNVAYCTWWKHGVMENAVCNISRKNRHFIFECTSHMQVRR